MPVQPADSQRLFERVQPYTAKVPIALIEHQAVLGRSLVKRSIEHFGQLTLPLVQEIDGAEPENGPIYRIVDGARRIDEMREQGIDEVMVAVLPATADDTEIAAMATSLNLLRAPNPIREAQHFATMIRAGFSAEEIGRRLGISKSTVSKRLKLVYNLIPELRERMESGEISIGVAERLANLPEAQQRRVLGSVAEGAKITGQDLTDALRVNREEAMERIDDALPGTQALFGPADLLEDALTAARAQGLGLDEARALLEQVYG